MRLRGSAVVQVLRRQCEVRRLGIAAQIAQPRQRWRQRPHQRQPRREIVEAQTIGVQP